jgi:hypothetical protein
LKIKFVVKSEFLEANRLLVSRSKQRVYRHRRKLPRLFSSRTIGRNPAFSVHSVWTAIRGEENAFSIVDEKAFSRGIEKVLKRNVLKKFQNS